MTPMFLIVHPTSDLPQSHIVSCFTKKKNATYDTSSIFQIYSLSTFYLTSSVAEADYFNIKSNDNGMLDLIPYKPNVIIIC